MVGASTSGDEGGDELAALMSLLEQETDLATHSKMNADFVPGMVTVLHSSELHQLGLENVAQALSIVAGFDINENNDGSTISLVRGVGASLDSNNLKMMLNGIPVNNAITGLAEPLLYLPVEQVDRIEVIRGPGASLYGEFAFSGVVNVITRKQSNDVAVKVGDNNLRQASVNLFGASSDRRFQWNLSSSAWVEDDSDRISNTDNFWNSGNGHSPGPVFDNNKGSTFLLGLDYDGYQFRAQYLNYQKGITFGRTAYTPEDFSPFKQSMLSFDVFKEWKLNEQLSHKLSLNYLQNDTEDPVHLTLPAGVRGPGGRPPTVTDSYRQDEHGDASFALNWEGSWDVSDHSLLLGLSHKKVKVTDVGGKVFDLVQPARYFTTDEMVVLDDTEREINSVFFQDQWHLTSTLDMTFGARYDDYDDLGGNLSPRVALVWRATDKHLFKAQYAEAFRPPTLQESYPGPLTPEGRTSQGRELDPEELASYELAYIYRSSGKVLRFTVFKTDIKNMIEFVIVPSEPPTYLNRGEISSYGAELEWQQAIGRSWEVLANVSYVLTDDEVTNDDVVGSIDWMSNVAVTWHTTRSVSQSVLVKYRGQQKGYPNIRRLDPENSFPEYQTLDYSVRWVDPMGIDGVSFSGTVKNVFDEDYAILSVRPTYEDGLPQEGRTWWAEVGYEF